MFHIKDRKTGQLFDQWRYLGPKRRRLLDESWAGLFRENILRELPVERMIPFFSSIWERPTKELYAMLGAILFQQIFDLTDEETVTQMAFNLQWHYALDIPEESDGAKYISPKTLWSMRHIVIEQDLDTVLFEQITDTLAKVFKVDTTQQRIDSVHIKSNMRRLGRIGILVRCLHKFLVNLKRQYKELFETLPQELVEKYLSEKAVSCFSLIKPSATERTLASVSQDLFQVVRHFMDNRQVQAMYSYSLLTRVLQEQCRVKETAEGELVEIEIKPPKEVPSDSLQNPSDPDASYSGHKGQGYQVQILETYSREAPEGDSAPKLELITHVQVEPAHKSDAHALIPALEAVAEKGLAPKEVLADSLYGSDENCEAAQEMGVEVVSPVKDGSAKKALLLPEFEFAPSGKVVRCPEGQEPVKVKCRGERYTATFEIKECQNCPRREGCPIQPGRGIFISGTIARRFVWRSAGPGNRRRSFRIGTATGRGLKEPSPPMKPAPESSGFGCGAWRRCAFVPPSRRRVSIFSGQPWSQGTPSGLRDHRGRKSWPFLGYFLFQRAGRCTFGAGYKVS